MKHISTYIRGIGAFFKTLVGPTSPVVGYGQYGDAILDGWGESPEEKAISEVENSRPLRSAKLALYGLEGAHSGSLFLFEEGEHSVGVDCHSDFVVSPAENAIPEFRGKLKVTEGCEITALDEHHILVNGKKRSSAHLFDFDEVGISGNRFLTLAVEDEGVLDVAQ